MSEQTTQPSQTSETSLVSKEVHIQEGYTPPPMATIQTTQLIPDDTKGYTPPPMPTVLLKPQASTDVPPVSSQPATTSQPATQGASSQSAESK